MSQSVLEKILKEVPHSEHPSPFPIELNPNWEGPWFDIGRVAVETLEKTEEIQSFMTQYIHHISEKYNMDLESAEKSAKAAVGYCTGYVDDYQANKWFRALPDISHPVSGRERPFLKNKQFTSIYVIGRSNDPEVRQYLLKRFNSDFPTMGLVIESDKIIEDRRQSEYFAIKLSSKNHSQLTSNHYMFLSGYVMATKISMNADLGKSCELLLEVADDKKMN